MTNYSPAMPDFFAKSGSGKTRRKAPGRSKADRSRRGLRRRIGCDSKWIQKTEANGLEQASPQGKRGTSAALGLVAGEVHSPNGARHALGYAGCCSAPMGLRSFFSVYPGRRSLLACPGLAWCRAFGPPKNWIQVESHPQSAVKDCASASMHIPLNAVATARAGRATFPTT